MEQDNDAAVLAGTDLFRGLDDERLGKLAERCRGVACNAGDLLLREGQVGYSLNVVVEGEIRIFLPKDESHAARISEVELARLGPGEVFGEYSFVDLRPVSASVAAVTDARMLQILHQDLRRLIDDDCELARAVYENLLVILIDRLRRDDQELDVFTNSWT